MEEEQMSSNVLAETVNDCISSLAEQRKDLWKIADTWGEVEYWQLFSICSLEICLFVSRLGSRIPVHIVLKP